MGRRIIRPVGFAVALMAAAAPLAGQGSSVYNHSGCASALGGAVIAAPCGDGSSVFYNPGALALQPSVLTAGLNVIYNEGSFTYDGTGEVVEREGAAPIVPHAYASYRFGADSRFAAGLGFWAPYGLGLEWPETFEGKYISWKTRLQGLYLQPTLAYQLIPGKLAIGAGPQIVFGGIEINQYVDAPVANPALSFLPLGTDIASAKLEGDGTGIGGHVGIFYEPNPWFSIGARYMLGVPVDLDGTADFTALSNPGIYIPVPGFPDPLPLDQVLIPQFAPDSALDDQTVAASLEFPPQAVVGIRVGPTEALDLTFDYQWSGWSTFDNITASFENAAADDLELVLNYEDAHTFRAGGTFAATPELDLRAGFIYNTAASPDETVTPILPEAERHLYTAGLGYDFGAARADIYYNFVNQADRRGRVRTELPGTYTIDDLNIGVYSTTAHLVGLTLSYVFGSAR